MKEADRQTYGRNEGQTDRLGPNRQTDCYNEIQTDILNVTMNDLQTDKQVVIMKDRQTYCHNE